MKILIAGDFSQKNRIDVYIRRKDFSSLFSEIVPYTKAVDYSIVNFEFPIVKESKDAKPIIKKGPSLSGSIEAVEAIKYAGFNCCTLANNHILDQGDICCLSTIAEIEKSGIDTVGCGDNLEEASAILYKKINDEKLAIINCCEHEFSLATNSTPGANPINPIQQFYKIQEARKNANYVVVITHGGHEHYQLPSLRMKETFRFYIDCGADAVINGHQHCFSGYEIYNGKPIVYGLGNLCFDNPSKKGDIWNQGYISMLDMSDNGIQLTIHPYTQCDEKIGVHFIHENDENFWQKIKELNDIISSDDDLRKSSQLYYASCSKHLMQVYNGYDNRILEKLRKMHIIPSRISTKRLLSYLNHLECESHRDKAIYSLKTILR